jgi:hypothetical protein
MASYASPVSGARKQVRRRLIVDAPFQLRALVPLILFLVIYLGLMALTFYRLHTAAATEPDPGVRAILGAQLNNLHLHFWPVLGVAGLLALYTNLHWSLRVAGPLYRLHRTLNELAEGEVKPLRFRRRDEFKVFEEDVATLSRKMQLIATRNRDILFAVHGHLKKLAERLAADEIIARADLDEAVRAMLAQLEKAPEVGVGVRR